jgi:hypothetical protein
MRTRLFICTALCFVACDAGSSTEAPRPDAQGPSGGGAGGGGAGGAGGLDARLPDVSLPDVSLPDAARPDAARPDAALPDAARPDAASPDAWISPLSGSLLLSPLSIDFGDLAAGARGVTQQVTVTNQGEGPLFIASLRLSGARFTATLGGADLTPQRLRDPDADGTPGLAPGASVVLDVGYTSADGSRATGELFIESSAPFEPSGFVSLVANHTGPCLHVRPATVEFGTVPVGAAARAPFTIQSCGTQPVRIERLTLTPEADASLSLAPDALPQLPALVPAMVPGQALPARDVTLVCSPTEARSYLATVEIQTNDPVQAVHPVSVACEGIADACPVPAVVEAALQVNVGESATLDAAPSSDPDGPGGRPVAYTWFVAERPNGSEATVSEAPGVPDDPTTPTATLTPDVAGTYEVMLTVADAHGLQAPSEICPDGVVTVRIVAP